MTSKPHCELDIVEEIRLGISHPHTLDLFERLVEQLEALREAAQDLYDHHDALAAGGIRMQRLGRALREASIKGLDVSKPVVCPVCGGELHRSSWFDDEGVEAWECGSCGFGEMGDWSKPPDYSDATDETEVGWYGETLGQLRTAYNTDKRS